MEDENSPMSAPLSPSKLADNIMDQAEDDRRLSIARCQPRRAGVAAQGMNVESCKDYVKPVYAKDSETCAILKGFIDQNANLQVLFGHLDAKGVEDVINAFQEVTFPQGIDIIKQGEEGDCLYILGEGQVDVFVARKGPDGQVAPGDRGAKAITLGPGALFGELALMYSAPRAATVCIASDTCKLWKLEQEPFKMMLVQNTHTQYEMYEGWLSEVDLLKSLNQYELSRLSEMMESVLFDADEEIIRQGEPGDKFFILEDGSCAAYITGVEGERKVKDYVAQGEYFGEIALLNDEPRRATVRATGQGASLLSVSQADFVAVLGPIQDRLKQEIDKYPQYVQFLQ